MTTYSSTSISRGAPGVAYHPSSYRSEPMFIGMPGQTSQSGPSYRSASMAMRAPSPAATLRRHGLHGLGQTDESVSVRWKYATIGLGALVIAQFFWWNKKAPQVLRLGGY